MKKLMLIFVVAPLVGCATIMDVTSQNVNLTTSNGRRTNATIYTANGVRQTQIPQTINVQKSKRDIIVKVNNRYNTETTTVPSKMNNWFWGNIILGGFFGSTTDSASGAMWEYDDNVIVQVNEPERYPYYQDQYIR